MASQLTDFLKTEVYPVLDAVEAGFLDHLEPRTGGGGGYAILRCPACEHREAFYYPGSRGIQCNRRNKCGAFTSLWDCMEQGGWSHAAIPEDLAAAVGVTLPGKADTGEMGSERQRWYQLAKAFDRLARQALLADETLFAYMRDERGWDPAEIQNAPIGYLANPRTMYYQLKKEGVDTDLAYVLLTKPNESGNRDWAWGMKGRIVGLWEQPDGSWMLWGRYPGEPTTGPKYLYPAGLEKSLPLFWRQARRVRTHQEPLVGVEGPLDAARLLANGIPAVGLGGQQVPQGIAQTLVRRNEAVVIWTDPDTAGIEGAEHSVFSLAPLGLAVTVFPSPAGDPDETIGTLGVAETRSRLQARQEPPGVFLGTRALEDRETLTDHQAIREWHRKIRAWRRKLLGPDRDQFLDVLEGGGHNIGDDEVAALTLMARLREAAIDPEEANRVVREKYGIWIAIEEVG